MRASGSEHRRQVPEVLSTHVLVPSSLGWASSNLVKSCCVIISSLGYFLLKSRLW